VEAAKRARIVEPTFRLKPGLYLIGSLERGLTVYKQQIRAHNLVWSLWELNRRKEINVDHVAIVGGGISGLTAAACFLSRFDQNIKVTLFEELWDLCPLQQGSDNRWLHPKIYDWPADGSRAPGASLPVLNWSEGRASDVARTIVREFSRFSEAFDKSEERLTIYLGLKHFRIDATKNKIEWVASKTKRAGAFHPIKDKLGKNEVFNTIVLATGFGAEKKEAQCRTHSYWRNEQLSQPRLDGKHQIFLVSGFGDGALIDLCRLTIEQYRQDTILYELFSNDLEKVETHLATERLKLDQDANLFEFFNQLREVLEPAREELLKRIRKDTSVVLHIAGKHGKVKSISDIFGPSSSFQNRMMAFLLYSCGAFSPSFDSLETALKKSRIPKANVLCRYGTDTLSHLSLMFMEMDQVVARLTQLKENQEQKPELFWEPGTFRQPPFKDNLK